MESKQIWQVTPFPAGACSLVSPVVLVESFMGSMTASWLALGGIAIATADLWRHFRGR